MPREFWSRLGTSSQQLIRDQILRLHLDPGTVLRQSASRNSWISRHLDYWRQKAAFKNKNAMQKVRPPKGSTVEKHDLQVKPKCHAYLCEPDKSKTTQHREAGGLIRWRAQLHAWSWHTILDRPPSDSTFHVCLAGFEGKGDMQFSNNSFNTAIDVSL